MKQNFRIEHDSLGDIEVPTDKYYGAQTERALRNFQIGNKVFPKAFIKSLAIVKKCAFLANYDLGEFGDLVEIHKNAITKSCDEIIADKLYAHFPLSIWQSGSGTQTHMNMNEVIANRANELLGSKLGTNRPIHPNDHINHGQSTNDIFPTAMQISTLLEIKDNLIPSIELLKDEFVLKAKTWKEVIKIGRTHLQDATPISVKQEFTVYVQQLSDSIRHIEESIDELLHLPIGGTAVGTGLNTKRGYDMLAIQYISKETGLPFRNALNKSSMIASHDNFVAVSGALKRLSVAITKIANDIRLLGSGPNAGISEYILPENEPGSSMMPGKVNPTQCESITMICARVMGNDVSIGIAGSQGHLQLNAYKPMIIYYTLESIAILTEGIRSFHKNCITGLRLNKPEIKKHLDNSLMLVTALTKHIGYEKSAKIAQKAYKDSINIRQASIELGFLSGDRFDEIVNPEKMINPEE
jgi:fumarate hydratase, class II